MKRLGLLTLAVTLISASAPATTVGPISVAPFAQTTALAGGILGNPCTDTSPASVRTPDAAAGRIDGDLAVSVTGCTVRTRSLVNNWKIADSPADLIGKRATVLLEILVDGVQAFQTGTASRSASYRLKVGTMEWNVMTVTCEGDGCHHRGNTLGPVMFPLGVTFDSLPAAVELSILRDARIEAPEGETASASIGVDVRATLLAVLIRAAD